MATGTNRTRTVVTQAQRDPQAAFEIVGNDNGALASRSSNKRPNKPVTDDDLSTRVE
jgi:hypothetical protein